MKPDESLQRVVERISDIATHLVGLVITSIVGWNFYSDNRQQNIEASTALYAEYVDAVAEAKAVIAQQIKAEFPDTSVHSLVALDEAKKAATMKIWPRLFRPWSKPVMLRSMHCLPSLL